MSKAYEIFESREDGTVEVLFKDKDGKVIHKQEHTINRMSVNNECGNTRATAELRSGIGRVGELIIVEKE